MTRILLLLALCIGICYTGTAQSSQQASSIYVVIHIDAMPQYARSASMLLDSLRHDSLWDKGIKSFKVLQEPGRTNHFTLIEEWVDRTAYDTYVSTQHVRDFRDKIQPMLGSPFDERLHIEVK